MIRITRRRFLTLTGGLLATGCAGTEPTPDRPGATTATTPPTAPTTTASAAAPSVTAPPSAVTVTTVTSPVPLVPDDRVLVMVELAGGNDAINTLVPDVGTYRDLRPTVAIDEDDLLASATLPEHGLHPALAPLSGHLDDGSLAIVAGVGFPDPDRSHFVSTDRWMRADRMNEDVGWIGRWLDTLPADPGALGATALGSTGRMLLGTDRGGTVIDAADAFALPSGLSHRSVRAMTTPLSSDPLIAAAQSAFATSVGAIEEFDAVADAVRADLADSGDGLTAYGGAFTTGLAVAAQLVTGDVGARVVTVSGAGFDTHGEQLGLQEQLLGDLAAGLRAFWDTVEAAGHRDRVLLMTHSEFGRRAAENGSGGTDHGAAGLSLVMGPAVVGGLHGTIDLGDLVDGDLRPVLDPRTMFTAALDWLGGDVERILGRRFDEVGLLRT